MLYCSAAQNAVTFFGQMSAFEDSKKAVSYLGTSIGIYELPSVPIDDKSGPLGLD
jgi:hypothetical protein